MKPSPADPEAWNAYLAEGNATQARKRVSADVLLRDEEGRVLLVKPTYKPGWDLPGGMAEFVSPPEAAPAHATGRRPTRPSPRRSCSSGRSDPRTTTRLG